MALIVGDFMVADDGVDRTFGNTDRAIYALIGMNDQKIGAFHKAIHRTNADAIRVLALNAGLGNYKCHGFPKPLFPSLAAIPILLFILRGGSRRPGRSEVLRVGKECVSTCRSRWSPYN